MKELDNILKERDVMMKKHLFFDANKRIYSHKNVCYYVTMIIE